MCRFLRTHCRIMLIIRAAGVSDAVSGAEGGPVHMRTWLSGAVQQLFLAKVG
jgi:hypothetical protein